MPCANASIMRFLNREPRGCAAITCSRCPSVNSEYARPRTSISTPAVTSATSGFLCCGMPGVVQRDGVPDDLDILLGDTPPAEKVSRGIGAVDLEPFGLAAVIGHQAHV